MRCFQTSLSCRYFSLTWFSYWSLITSNFTTITYYIAILYILKSVSLKITFHWQDQELNWLAKALLTKIVIFDSNVEFASPMGALFILVLVIDNIVRYGASMYLINIFYIYISNWWQNIKLLSFFLKVPKQPNICSSSAHPSIV